MRLNVTRRGRFRAVQLADGKAQLQGLRRSRGAGLRPSSCFARPSAAESRTVGPTRASCVRRLTCRGRNSGTAACSFWAQSRGQWSGCFWVSVGSPRTSSWCDSFGVTTCSCPVTSRSSPFPTALASVIEYGPSRRRVTTFGAATSNIRDPESHVGSRSQQPNRQATRSWSSCRMAW